MGEQAKKYVRVIDIPAIYSLGRSTIYRMRDRGELTIHKIGGAALVKVKVTDLESLIEGNAA